MCACKEQDGSLVKVYELNMQFSCKINPGENCKSGEIYFHAEKERELSFPAFRNDRTWKVIITGSIYTVAAAVNYSAETEHAVTSDGVELANGDIVYAGLDENGFTYGMIRAVEISVDYNGDVQTVSLQKVRLPMCLKEQALLPHITRWLSRHFNSGFG